jgi:hypothetical protein
VPIFLAPPSKENGDIAGLRQRCPKRHITCRSSVPVFVPRRRRHSSPQLALNFQLPSLASKRSRHASNQLASFFHPHRPHQIGFAFSKNEKKTGTLRGCVNTAPNVASHVAAVSPFSCPGADVLLRPKLASNFPLPILGFEAQPSCIQPIGFLFSNPPNPQAAIS